MTYFTIEYEWQGQTYHTVVSAADDAEAKRTFEAAAPHVRFISAEESTMAASVEATTT